MTDEEAEEDHIASLPDDQIASTSAESESQKEEVKKIGHRCPMCDFVARFPNKLRMHISIKHPTQARFPCTKCEKRFESYIQLRKHCQEEHPKVHRCPDCEYKHRIKSYVDKHYRLNHVNGVICSLGCGRTVAMNMLKKHIEQCQKKDVEEKTREPIEVWNNQMKVSEHVLKCEICGYVADKSSNDEKLIMEDLNMHISRIHGKGVKCPFECGKYLKVDELDDHVRSEHSESAKTTEELLRNEDTVSSITRVEDDDFISSSDNDEGIDSDDSEDCYAKTGELLRNQCAKCLKRFNCSRDLTRHHNRVHKKKYGESSRKITWMCCDFEEDGKKCEKRFRCQSLLDDHMNMHRNIYPYYCRNCDRKFTARARFAVHLSKYHQTSIKSYGILKNNLFKK